MRTKITLLSLLLCYLFSAKAIVGGYTITKEMALEAAKKQFQGLDVDYYILQDDNQTEWTIFVDAEPMKGWEHECCILTIPKKRNSISSNIYPTSTVYRRQPPTGNYVPLSVKNRYGEAANSAPHVNKDSQSNATNPAAQRTYAVILSGGINKISNYERYWNDCSFIYQTLVNKYGVPKDNIFPIMSDGNNPEPDMRSVTGEFKSQPLDLDYDGVADIKLSATKANVTSTLSYLTTKMKKDDHLFFFVIDHGGSTDYMQNSYICLWNNEKLYDYQLANMLTPFTSKYVNVNVVLGQCYSGGFNDNLTKIGCVVASASKGSEPSWACPDIPYDEFVYQWTCAVNGANHIGTYVYSDYDNNRRVTMEEAFGYAKTHDRETEEHPQYVSTPMSVGEDLAFNHLAPSVDLFMRDNWEDTGKEPNMTTDKFWISPDIWVRNQDDGIFVHENPVYSPDHGMAYIYANIRNRGKEKFDGKGKWLILYWALASTSFTDKVWKGRETSNDGNPTGGILEAKPIPAIEAGDSVLVRVRWALPNLLEDEEEGNFHFCLSAKIMDVQYDDGYVDGKTYFDKRGSNDQVQKNVSVIRKKDNLIATNVYVRNFDSSQKSYTLELIPQTASDALLFSKAKVEMNMGPKVYSAWERGGFLSQDVELPQANSNGAALRTVKFLSPQSKLQAVKLNGNEFDKVKLKFAFNEYSSQSITYNFDLIQKDENGNIVGGETFIVESPTFSNTPLNIKSAPQEDGKVQLEVTSPEYKTFKWQNENGETIGNSETVTVTPKINGNKYKVVAVTEDGEAATESVSLETENGIKSVSTAPNSIVVDLKSSAPINASISVMSVLESCTKLTYDIPEGAASASLNSASLTKGIYTICYIVDDEIIDKKKISIK